MIRTVLRRFSIGNKNSPTFEARLRRRVKHEETESGLAGAGIERNGKRGCFGKVLLRTYCLRFGGLKFVSVDAQADLVVEESPTRTRAMIKVLFFS